jgi:formylglycine-generating enzyme required for sulfatase activity
MVAWDGGTGTDNNGNMWNVGGNAYGNAWIEGEVPAILRGGSWDDGSNAGVFAFDADNAPSLVFNAVGFRCGRRR